MRASRKAKIEFSESNFLMNNNEKLNGDGKTLILYEVLKVYTFDGLVAQLVRAPPCHGGGHGFEARLGRFIWDLSSAGRASALQAEGHRFEPYWSHRYGWIPEWPKGADCKSVGNAFEGSNPSPSISQHGLCRCGSIGRAADL